VAVLIKNREEETIERFVFDMAFQCYQGTIPEQQFPVDIVELEQELQQFLMTIIFRSPQLKPLPQDSTFSIVVYLLHMVHEVNEESPLWITIANHEVSDATIKPLKSFSSPLFKFQLYAEENRQKK